MYPAVPLTEEEIRLTVVMTFSEGSNGTHSEESLRMLAWTYLNKKTIRMPGSDMYDVLSGMSRAWDDLGTDPIVENGVGRKMPTDPIGKRAWMLDAYTMYYERTFTDNGNRFRNKVDPIVRSAVSQWRTHGSNSAVDPTHGASAYSHQDDPLDHPSIEDRFDQIRRDFYAKALVDPNFNYAISQPYIVSGRPTVLVVGPVDYWPCVTTGSCQP